MIAWLTTYWLELFFGTVLGLIAWGGRKLIYFYVKEMKQMLGETEKKILDLLEQK